MNRISELINLGTVLQSLFARLQYKRFMAMLLWLVALAAAGGCLAAVLFSLLCYGAYRLLLAYDWSQATALGGTAAGAVFVLCVTILLVARGLKNLGGNGLSGAGDSLKRIAQAFLDGWEKGR